LLFLDTDYADYADFVSVSETSFWLCVKDKGFASSEIVRQPFYLVRDNRHKVMKCQPFTVGRQPQKSEEIPRRYARSG
jgi:hypothetical protein